MKKITTLAVSLLTAACMSAGALAADQPLEKVAPFPKAEKGMKRQVIQLPQQQDESALKVELIDRPDAGSRLQPSSPGR